MLQSLKHPLSTSPSYNTSGSSVGDGCLCKKMDIVCPEKYTSAEAHKENILDVADSIVEIMKICRIHPRKAVSALDAIKHVMTHFSEIRRRIETVPHKRLCKEDLIHDLGQKCGMNRIEVQMTYSIVKRAFRAYYYGTGEGGIMRPDLMEQLKHTQECLWVHAAVRTAQVFATYEGMSYAMQKKHESRFKCVYNRLYEIIKKRHSKVDEIGCNCNEKKTLQTIYRCISPDGALKQAISNASSMSHVTLQTSSEFKSSTTINFILEDDNDSSESLEEIEKCTCPRLACDNVDDSDLHISVECSQGPYICRWLPVDEEGPRTPPCKPEPPSCPKSCNETEPDGLSCADECICTCDVCECVDEYPYGEAHEENTHEFDANDYRIEDKDSFYFVADICDPNDKYSKKSETTIVVDEEFIQEETYLPEEEELKEINPADINYVASIGDDHSDPQVEEIFLSEKFVPVPVKSSAAPYAFVKAEPHEPNAELASYYAINMKNNATSRRKTPVDIKSNSKRSSAGQKKSQKKTPRNPTKKRRATGGEVKAYAKLADSKALGTASTPNKRIPTTSTAATPVTPRLGPGERAKQKGIAVNITMLTKLADKPADKRPERNAPFTANGPRRSNRAPVTSRVRPVGAASSSNQQQNRSNRSNPQQNQSAQPVRSTSEGQQVVAGLLGSLF